MDDIFEPMHQHEYINDLWEYEVNMMSHQELLDWAEKGFKVYLYDLPEEALKRRYKAFEDLVMLSNPTFEE